MSSRVATLVGEVAAVITAAAPSLPLPVMVVASRLPVADLADLAPELPVRVTVVPHLPDGRSVSQASRGVAEDLIEIDVGVQRRVTSDAGEPLAADVDALLGLSEAVCDLFRPGMAMAVGGSGASWVRSVHAVLYDPAHLLQHSTFTGVLTLTFAIYRGQ